MNETFISCHNIIFIPFLAKAGFLEGENGYDLKKIEESLDYPVMKLEMMIVLQEH